MEDDQKPSGKNSSVNTAATVLMPFITALVSAYVFFQYGKDVGQEIAEANARARAAELPNTARELKFELTEAQQVIASLERNVFYLKEKINDQSSSLTKWENVYTQQQKELNSSLKTIAVQSHECNIYKEIEKTRSQIDQLRDSRDRWGGDIQRQNRYDSDIGLLEARLSQFIGRLDVCQN